MKSLVDIANRKTERAFLVGAEWRNRPSWEFRDSMDELAQLALSAGAEIMDRGTQRLERPVAATLIGRGKVEEFAQRCQDLEVDTVIFDDELSPAQARTLESIFQCKVLDRTALILDIFAQRAQTREGKLQVELAQLKHLLPRLTGFWTHLSRQKGGIGMRGDGESQLETDRRRILERLDRLNRELGSVRRQRATQRAGRKRNLWPLASLVGYTNAGKSTLFNALTNATVLEEDKLFATLDPTTRRLRLPTNQNILLSDTVGFISKLPHQLVEAFKATLEEVNQADLLLHVVDASHPRALEQIQAVHTVLDEIGSQDKPSLLVLNKTDLLEGGLPPTNLLERASSVSCVSALTQAGFQDLAATLGTLLQPVRREVQLLIPCGETQPVARLHEVGQILELNYDGDQIQLKALIPPQYLNEFHRYETQPSGPTVDTHE